MEAEILREDHTVWASGKSGSLLAWIEEETGFKVSGSRRDFLSARIQEMMRQKNLSEDALLEQVRMNSRLRQDLMNRITITETSFLRNPPQMNFFATKILPELVERRRRKGAFSLRIWSAGCSQGAEAYSLGILLLEGMTLPEAWEIEILATDINSGALKRLEEGVYPEEELLPLGPERIDRFFTVSGPGKRRVISELRRRIRAQPHNILDPPPGQNFDIIFCRNLLIYMRTEVVRSIFRRFEDVLAFDGALFLGHSEFPILSSTRWRLLSDGEAVCYRVRS